MAARGKGEVGASDQRGRDGTASLRGAVVMEGSVMSMVGYIYQFSALTKYRAHLGVVGRKHEQQA